MSKEKFLKEEFINLLKQIDVNTKPFFGKMNPHQMIEHMSHAFQIASGKVVFESNQNEALTEKMYGFMMSDKPFKDNTPNPNLGEMPIPPRYNNVKDSLNDLETEILYFFEMFDNTPELRIANPFFGHLNREEQIHLLHKHSLHHLRQFGIIP
jgi:hypothetical protein